jgi:hypothetical protein
MRVKHSNILKNTDWNILIILDACRFDTFKKIIDEQYKDFTFCVNSEASDTLEWLKKHFNGNHFDTVYISGNPFVNSKNINAKEYNAKDHFLTIIDSWDEGFDKSEGRIMPVAVYFDYLTLKYDYKKAIIHFVQPHSPYIFKRKKRSIVGFIKWLIPYKFHIPLFKKFYFLIPEKQRTFIKTISTYKKKYTNNEIKEAYEENLRSVLYYVYELIYRCNSKNIIITSDHGEYLGEDGKYGHGGKKTKLITSVPFLNLEN